MHAVLITVKFLDRDGALAEVPGLAERASGAPGFQSGHWVEFPKNRGVAMLIFDSEGAAQAFLQQAQAEGPASTIEMVSAELGRVEGSA